MKDVMEATNNLLERFSVEDIEKVKLFLSLFQESSTNEAVTLRVFINEYSDLIKNSRSTAYYNSVISSLKHLTDYFGAQKILQTINMRDVESFVSYLQQKIKKGYRVYYRTLKAAFNKAIDWNYIKVNYFVKVKLPKKQKTQPAYINRDQLDEIVKGIENELVKDIVVFAFYTGMRLNEIMNLRWRNVNISSMVITVGDESFTTKGKNQRFIPISSEVLEVLKKREKRNLICPTNIIPINSINMNDEFVFVKENSNRITGDYVSKSFKRGCKASGAHNSIHFHSLRHSFASNLVQKGVPLYAVKELLGHSSISTTEIYSHLNMESLKDAIKKLDTNNY